MVSHGSYLQPSKDLQGLPIKTLLKHFWCCQQQRAEIAQPLRRCDLPPATPVLSILWAGRYKISNNLISTSKFHRLSELAALLMWVCRDQGRGPLRERKIWVKSWPPSLKFIHGWLKTPLYTPCEELQEWKSSGHCWVPLEVCHFWIELFLLLFVTYLEDKLCEHHLANLHHPWEKYTITEGFVTHLIFILLDVSNYLSKFHYRTQNCNSRYPLWVNQEWGRCLLL